MVREDVWFEGPFEISDGWKENKKLTGSGEGTFNPIKTKFIARSASICWPKIGREWPT